MFDHDLSLKVSALHSQPSSQATSSQTSVDVRKFGNVRTSLPRNQERIGQTSPATAKPRTSITLIIDTAIHSMGAQQQVKMQSSRARGSQRTNPTTARRQETGRRMINTKNLHIASKKLAIVAGLWLQKRSVSVVQSSKNQEQPVIYTIGCMVTC